MKVNPVKKIAVALIFIILLPLIFFTFLELNSLKESDAVFENIYKNQLDQVLLSVNRFSEDVVREWSNRIINLISEQVSNERGSFEKNIRGLLEEIPSIKMIVFVDSLDPGEMQSFSNLNESDSKVMEGQITRAIIFNQKIFKRLQVYKIAGYRKIEPLEEDIGGSNLAIFFLDEPFKGKSLCGVLLDSKEYIRQVLTPKIQEAAQEDFIISVHQKNTNELVFLSESREDIEIELQKPIGLIPSYSLGIMLKGETIESIVKARSYFNLILIISLNTVLIIGLWFLYRNIKKQIELAQIKSDFVSNVSHELRTPLALIGMFAETLEMDRVKSDDKRKEYYKIISQETNRLSRIVNSILNFSKMESGKRKYNFEYIDCNSVIENVLDTYNFHLKHKGFEITFEKDEKISKINADNEAISEAFINLLDNAVKYSNDRKEVFVRTKMENESVLIEVQDFGIGISSEEQNKIFDKFYRASNGLVHNTKGTGLGLSLVNHIMDAHKGKIELESTPGEGSTFRLIFNVS